MVVAWRAVDDADTDTDEVGMCVDDEVNVNALTMSIVLVAAMESKRGAEATFMIE